MYHYVYRITNIVDKKYYYGKRSTKYSPDKDLGIRYFSSSRDQEFQKDQRSNKGNYKYKVIKICSSVQEALELEVRLHAKFDVGNHPSFYNRCKQTSTKFDTTGLVYTDEQREMCRIRRLGCKHSESSIQKCRNAKLGNSWNIGRRHTAEAISNMQKASKKGINHPNARLVDIYDKTDKLIAKAVVLHEWCKDDKSLRSNLATTLKADRSKPSSRSNPCYHKGLYAQYTSV